VGLPGEGVVEDITRKKAASSANQSSDLRQKMMKPETVAQAVVNALVLSAESTVEELVIIPSAGTL